MVDLFNLSDAERRIEGSMPAATLGIALDHYYRRNERWAGLGAGHLAVGCTLPPWGHQQVELEAL